MNQYKYQNKKPYNLNDTIDFGRHKGQTIKQIISCIPEYIIWAMENITGFVICNHSMKLLSEIEQEHPDDTEDLYEEC